MVFLSREYSKEVDGSIRDEKVYTKKSNYTQVGEQCKQDWLVVFILLQDVLRQVKKENPCIVIFVNAIIQSDNAACYHSALFMFSVGFDSNNSGIKIVHFNESQRGKVICDSTIVLSEKKPSGIASISITTLWNLKLSPILQQDFLLLMV